MTKPRRTKVKFGGTEIPELFTEKLRGRVVYYFKNDKGNKIRREHLNEAILELNKYKQSINMPVIPILVEEGAISQYQQDKISEIEKETGTKIYPGIKIKRRVPVHKQDSEGRTRRIEIDAEYNIPKEWLLDQFSAKFRLSADYLLFWGGENKITHIYAGRNGDCNLFMLKKCGLLPQQFLYLMFD